MSQLIGSARALSVYFRRDNLLSVAAHVAKRVRNRAERFDQQVIKPLLDPWPLDIDLF